LLFFLNKIKISIKMNKFFLQTGSLLGAIGVMIGAFGAHALKPMLLASGRFDTFETAVRYQFYHALALVLVGILAKEIRSKTITYSAYSFLAGTLIFSGSLYLICFTGITAFGAVAPIGGTLLVVAWLLLFLSVFKN
jgi:uncharacterized membrane protein YgdD (TMEM256/DUF423 family)